VHCALAEWGAWGLCSASCNGGKQSRYREVMVHPKNGGLPCGPTNDLAECNSIPCYLLQLNVTLQHDCGISIASELDTVLVTLLAAGVKTIDDLCLLEHAQLRPARIDPLIINSLTVTMPPASRPDSAVAMLPVTRKRLQRCICDTLCKSSGSPICTESQEKVDQVRERDELSQWIQGSCSINEGLKEIVDALQAFGVEKLEDLRYTTEVMVDGLSGVSAVRRQKLRTCLRAFLEKEL
jgi:hypothetical protein